jgi:hypothetical protein
MFDTISNKLTCPTGFLLDLENKNCFLALNESRSFWNATTDSCSAYHSHLVEFDSDNEVQGLIKLVKQGNIGRSFKLICLRKSTVMKA